MKAKKHNQDSLSSQVENGKGRDPTTLESVCYAWLEFDQAKNLGQKNKDRQKNDLLNYERALRCLAAGAGSGDDDLTSTSAELLRTPDPLFGKYVEAGAALLNARRNKVPPSEKTIQNLIACCKALRVVLKGEGQVYSRSLYRVMLEQPKLKYRNDLQP